MQRDDEYIRDFLFEIEKQDDFLVLIPEFLDASPAERKKLYHAQLLCDSGYMIQISDTGYRLTAQGHDFISSIRDEGIWNKTKAAVAETGGNATLEVVKNLAYGFLKKKISDHTSVEL